MNVSVEYLGEKTFKVNTVMSSYILDCKERIALGGGTAHEA